MKVDKTHFSMLIDYNIREISVFSFHILMLLEEYYISKPEMASILALCYLFLQSRLRPVSSKPAGTKLKFLASKSRCLTIYNLSVLHTPGN